MTTSNLRTPSQSDLFARNMAEKVSEQTTADMKAITYAGELKSKGIALILFDWYADYSEDELSQFANPGTDRDDKDHPEWKEEPFPDYYKITIKGEEINLSFYQSLADNSPWGVVCCAHVDAIQAAKAEPQQACPESFKKLPREQQEFSWDWISTKAPLEIGRIAVEQGKWQGRRNRNRTLFRQAGELLYQGRAIESMGTVGYDYKLETDPNATQEERDNGTAREVVASTDKPIVIWDKPDTGKPVTSFKNIGLSTFRNLDVAVAKETGNNLAALLKTVAKGTQSDNVAIEDQEAVVTVGMKLADAEAALALLDHWATPANQKALFARLASKDPAQSDDLARTLYDLAGWFSAFYTPQLRKRVEALAAAEADKLEKQSKQASAA